MEDNGWAFEGSPVADGERIYVAMRRSKVRPQAYVGCYDARTGRPLWRQFVCSAETPARGQIGECTHNLLTLERGKLYYSTNLGAVAALATRDGHVQWITCYPRAKTGDLNQRSAHFYRDLTPCVFDRGRLFVAPSDTERVFALDAATGLMLWETSLAKDVVHLLGRRGRQFVGQRRQAVVDQRGDRQGGLLGPRAPRPRVGAAARWPAIKCTFRRRRRFTFSTRDRAARNARLS